MFDGAGNELPGGSAENNRYMYTGREWDADLALYHYRARMYDPYSGRFCSRDPIGYEDGQNLYRAYFVPSKVDPFGLDDKPAEPEPVTLPKCPDGCSGWCIAGRTGLKVVSCEVTKLELISGGLLCNLVTKGLICPKLKEIINKNNEKAEKEEWEAWQSSFCSDGCECDPKSGTWQEERDTVVLKDNEIRDSGCVFKVSGKVKLKGRYRISSCKKKE